MKKATCFLLAALLIATLCVPAGAIDSVLSEEDVLRAIEDGSAEIITEVRDVASFSEDEIAGDEGLSSLLSQLVVPYDVNTAQITHSAYSATVTMPTSGEVVVYRSVPKVTISVSDIMGGGTGVITTTLTIDETVTVNGTLTGGWTNLIRYRNLTSKLGCGVNTTFMTRARVEGDSVVSEPLAMFGWLAGVANVATVSNIISALELVNPSGSYVSSNGDLTGNTRAVGAEWKSNVYICESSHNLYLESQIATINSSAAKNVYTNAVAKWTYDVFVGGALDQSGEDLTIPTVYINNMT